MSGGNGLLPIDLVYAQQDPTLSTRPAGDFFFFSYFFSFSLFSFFFSAQTPPNYGTNFVYSSKNMALSEDNSMFG